MKKIFKETEMAMIENFVRGEYPSKVLINRLHPTFEGDILAVRHCILPMKDEDVYEIKLYADVSFLLGMCTVQRRRMELMKLQIFEKEEEGGEEILKDLCEKLTSFVPPVLQSKPLF